ncbi:MAG: glycosyltransferase family 8 protein [Bacteroidales bacterium]|nr:glycosyltransferase family 8 protein [Bacteroidales bacterium]
MVRKIMTTPLAIAFTPNYFVPAATMLRSLLDASADGNFEVICLVTEEIPVRMQEKLLRLGKGRLSFRYITLKGRLEGVYTDPRYTEAASFRLLLPELLQEYDSLLYIDCDVIVRQDLARLYRETALADNYLGVVFEAPIEDQANRFRALGCDPRRYFNSGFLLMNLKAMREEKVSEKLLEACKVPYLEFPDQDALNQVCQGRVLPLSPLYNGIRTFFLPQYKADFCRQYPQEGLWEKVQQEATIHYTGGKPWQLLTVQFAAWWRTYDSLPEEIKAEWEAPAQVQRLWHLYRNKPIGWLIETSRSLKRKLR